MSSLWRAQLGALGLDDAAAAEPASRAEAALLRQVRLPPLRLSEQAPARPWRFGAGPRRFTLVGPAIGAVALVLAVGGVVFRSGDTLRVKGAGVGVYWERAGQVKALGEGGPLREGDRVTAEIEAADDGFAYLAAADAQGQSLVGADFIRGSELPLVAGKHARFPQSLRLTGPAVGETLVVVLCAGGPLGDLELKNAPTKLPARCRAKSVRLR